MVFLWHHHQPDYRSPATGVALLPWVRLHATKDYLDMARRLERRPGLRASFNFVPSLLDQIEAAIAGGADTLFDLLARPIASLEGEERRLLAERCAIAPPWAVERWPFYRKVRDHLARHASVNGGLATVGDADLLAIEIGFLLAWIDPMFLGEPEAAAAGAARGAFTEAERDGLLALHRRLLADVIPAYRALAERGQIELSESPYYHPILPLVIDNRSARRARPDLPLPSEPFSAPEDAARHVERAIARHARAFGAAPRGMWPSEGSVSPEALEIAARSGLRWLASDESVLWLSLPAEARNRGALYRPWRCATPAGEVALFFRDRELSDRIGFVYQHWDARQAAGDFVERVRRIGREHGGDGTPVVSVILDGENCWEHYADDGGPFLDAVYDALEAAPDLHTRTPSQVLEERASLPLLTQVHSGSWINADFRIWIGHPEKNRAWDLLARTRRALVDKGVTPESNPAAWEALYAAEGSDWMWWFGDDHYTPDKAMFDRLFREHLQGACERAGVPVPGWLQVPVTRLGAKRELEVEPVGFVRPTLDGRQTGFYEWKAAGRHPLGAGGSSMHRGDVLGKDLFYGFDPAHLHLRLDFAEGVTPGADLDLAIEFLAPRPAALRVRSLGAGRPEVTWSDGARANAAVDGARCQVDRILELSLPFASLGLSAGESVEALGHLMRGGQRIETIPADRLIRFTVPDETFEEVMWSA